MEPSVSNLAGKLRISYDVPHRIFSSKLYPLKAPNGSTVIIYGHELGIRILWRGGRRFRHPRPLTKRSSVNGSTNEDAMVLDSGDDGSEMDDTPSILDFEAAEEEGSLSGDCDQILRQIDLPCGACVRQLAVPHLPRYITESAPGAFPPILLCHIVVAAACSDGSIRLVTLPLLPPHPSLNDVAHQSVQILTIGSPNSHREIPSSIAITHSATSQPGGGSAPSRSESRSRASEEENIAKVSQQPGRKWCFLVASVSATTGGLLLAHQIPLESERRFSTALKDIRPFKRCFLGLSILSAKIAFNPLAFPAERHSSLLLSLADSGCVKMLQVYPDEGGEMRRGRRDSTATADSASSSLHASAASSKSNFGQLMTLYSGYHPLSEELRISRRKRILDADWAAAGGAIIVLLEDGEWGVWDVQGVAPGSRPGDLFQGQTKMSGIQGGALTKFAIGGQVTAVVDAMSKHQKPEPGGRKAGKLAPMTPHTRKVRGKDLFAGQAQSFEADVGPTQSIQGHVYVTEHATSKPSSLSAAEESIVLAHGSDVIHISSLQALWRAKVSSKGTFDSVETVRPSVLRDLALEDERVIAIAELSLGSTVDARAPLGVTNCEAPEFLVVGDRRLLLYVSPCRQPVAGQERTAQNRLGTGVDREATMASNIDRSLLRRGQLDVEGMDRILEEMGQQGGSVNGRPGLFPTKSIAFDMGEEEEMLDVSSPTPRGGGRFRRGSQRPSTGHHTGVFS